MTTHLLRFDPDMIRTSHWIAAEGLAPRGDTDDGYGWHALLCAAFGKANAPKPFQLVARRGRPVQLLAYSTQPAAELISLAADFADPKAFTALGVDRLASKQMPAFASGRRLGFSLRVRPVVRADRDGNRAKTREIDAYVHALEKDTQCERVKVYLDWVRSKLTLAGAETQALRLDGLESVKVQRRGVSVGGTRKLIAIPGHSVHVAGTLEVKDATRFNEALARGIGRHRAFGFGMLLLSPPEE